MSKIEISQKQISKIYDWAQSRVLGLFILNFVIMFLVVLRSAGYFLPYFPITINFIVFIGLILAILLLSIRSRALFIISLVFWIITAVFRIMGIETWAERASIYAFQALIVGLVVFIIEVIISSRYSRRKN